MFVAIEGLDGVGKTTMAHSLAGRVGGVAMNTPGPWLRAHSDEILAELGSSQTARCLYYTATVVAQGRRAREAAREHVVVMDRYWLSTIAYARARGVGLDVDAIESAVPAPDLTVLVTLDEGQRRARLRSRGGATSADIESLDPLFRATVLAEMRSASRRLALRPIELDVTGADRDDAVRRLEALLLHHAATPPGNAP